MSMTYQDLLNAIIETGIEAARADYGQRAGDYVAEMLRGSIEGFEACRGKTPAEIVALWQTAERSGMWTGDPAAHWHARCRAAEIEWVLNVLSVGMPEPLLAWLPTARAAIQYAKIVGVKEAPSP